MEADLVLRNSHWKKDVELPLREPKCLRFKYISQEVSQLNVSYPLRQAGKLWAP